MIILSGLVLTAVFLAYANGANDNFKGVATLFGSGTTSYRISLGWACLTTLAGSLGAVWLSTKLVTVFSGKGLVPDTLAATPSFLISVGLGAAATVVIATWLGLPISTTHSLTGALVGAGLARGPVAYGVLGTKFFLPLLFSPLVAALLATCIYLVFRAIRLNAGIDKESCLCAGPYVLESQLLAASGEQLFRRISPFTLRVASKHYCRESYLGDFAGISISNLIDRLHFLSAGAVGFARGLNDTPKIAALLVAGSVLTPFHRYLVVAVFMALGGWLSARRVAETMSHKVTTMNSGQGFSANLATAFLVIVASRFGLPVSTTHVSVGSVFGIGAVSGGYKRKVVSKILLSWIATLPLAALLSAGISACLTIFA